MPHSWCRGRDIVVAGIAVGCAGTMLSMTTEAPIAAGLLCAILGASAHAIWRAIIPFRGRVPSDSADAVRGDRVRWLGQLHRLVEADAVAHELSRMARQLTGRELVDVVVEREPGDHIATQEVSATRQISEYRRSSFELELDLMAHEKCVGVLRLGPRSPHSMPESIGDLQSESERLEELAWHGSIAISNALTLEQVEHQRQQQGEAWRQERGVLVETIAAEITHEIRYPLNFFRSIFARIAGGTTLGAEDVDIGWEEVERLERMVQGLRRMSSPHVERRPVSIATLCARAEILLRDVFDGRRLCLEIAEPAYLDCDPDKVTQVLVNLISNSLEAAGTAGEVGVIWNVGGSGAELIVWDDGPGFEGGQNRLFAPWFTTKPRGNGLGLAITHRLVRAHGWSIDASRVNDRTLFAVRISPNHVITIRRAESPGHRKQGHEQGNGQVA